MYKDDDERLAFIFGGVSAAKKATKKFVNALHKFPRKINWTKISYRMGQSLESYLDCDCDVFIFISQNPQYTHYDTCVSGAATVPNKFSPERDLEIHIDISPDLYNNTIPVTDEYCKYFEKLFTLTFIHELTHTTQYDDLIEHNDSYFESPFEIDAYSTECAYEMSLNGGIRTTTEAYLRYNSVRDRKIFQKFRDMTVDKFNYLKNHK